MSSASTILLHAVRRRLALARLGRRSYRMLWNLVGVFGVLLVAHRFFDLGPDLFDPWVALALPVLALILAGTWGRATSQVAAARAMDFHGGTKDLFLTRALLGGAQGAYKPLVKGMAEARAAGMSARDIAPLTNWSRWCTGAAAVSLLVLGTVALPSLDLLGGEEDKRQAENRQRSLREHKVLALERAEVLRKKDVTAEQSASVEASLEQLMQTFQLVRRPEPDENQQRLNEQQRMLGELWRRAREKGLGRTAGRSGQSLGAVRNGFRQWREELESGSAEGLKGELEGLDELTRAMGESGDVLRQQAMSSELMDRLRALREFARREAGSPELEQALARLMQQLQIMDLDGVDPEALEAMLATMELASLEMDALAQSMRDLKMLEMALETLHLAELLNQLESLEGAQCEALGDYAEHYRQLLADQLAQLGACAECQGSGCAACNGTGKAGAAALLMALSSGAGMGATGGVGLGQGGVVGEDPTGTTGFVPERSRSALTAGRILMQLKNTEVAEGGKADVDYDSAVRDMHQGVSEAILRENVPPGYHEAIRRYFDKLADRKPR